MQGLGTPQYREIQNRQRLIQRMYSCWLCTAMPKDPAGEYLIGNDRAGQRKRYP
ncbi:hypothetical protein HMPREF1986_00478 [Oribacterium sp. oral taxon 078 str. F0263]|nr:hypothetical protein HMPREF1986_00478 [Oribacterium sp. oral taxon 078 str. F0263]